MIPSSNLLEEAFEVINTNPVLYKKYKDRVLNEVGQYITGYENPITIEASVQAVNTDTYQELGLDFQKQYLMFYFSTDAAAITRDSSGDIVIFNGKEYQCLSELSWFEIDGWVGMLAVKI